MKTKLAIILFLLMSLLTACNFAKSSPTAIPSIPPTSLPFPTSLPTEEPPPVIVITPSTTPSLVDQTVIDRASEVIQVLKDQDFITLSAYIHPVDGLRFSPYAFVSDSDVVLSADEVADILADSRSFTWGLYSGSGESISLSFMGYYSQFIYDVDFANAPKMDLNHRLGVSTSMDNIFEFYPSAKMVEFYFPGFDPQFDGMDWRSLRLVFTQHDSIWYLVGIVHDQWTT